MKNDNILKLSNVTKTYPGVVALGEASMEIRRGEIHALVGENGAGKSTLIKTITGAIQPDSGRISFDGIDYMMLNPELSQKIGISSIYQELMLAPPLTVMENIFMGQRINSGAFVDKKLLCRKAGDILSELGSNIDPNEIVRNLTIAYMQVVEIAKAISKNAKFLIMDEPTAPLTEDEVGVLMKMIRKLNGQGITILYISHRLEEIFSIADRVTVMRDGKVITTKDINEVDKARLIYHMVGRNLSETFPKRNTSYGKTALEVRELTGEKNKPISFSIKYGEILGFGGLVGSGRTELVRLIFGADPKTSGQIFIDGKEVNINCPKDAIDLGIGLVPEDRKSQGTIQNFSIKHNISLPFIKKISKLLGVIDTRVENEIVDKEVEELNIKTPSNVQLIKNLSGGNQQKVVVGKWLASESNILVLDEPTRGIDVGAKQEIYNLINALAEEGKAIMVISSDMEEILGLTDRMIILYEGEYKAELDKSEYTQERVLKYASGEENIVL